MPPTPVRQLTIVHLSLTDPVSVPLPWDTYPQGMQEVLDALDRNDDGTLVYDPSLGGPSTTGPAEAHHAGETADQLNRILWGYAWAYPHNSRLTDNAAHTDRWRRTQSLQNALYDRVALPLLGDRSDPARWHLAQRILTETGDFIHLTRLAQVAKDRWIQTSQIEFLRIAEEFLLSARRYAASVRVGRSEYLPTIAAALSPINQALDQIDRTQFLNDIKFPYLMATLGSPLTADLATLEQGDGLIYFGVAVPQTFLQENHDDPSAALIRFFNETSHVTLRASRFQDHIHPQEFPLTAIRAERDEPGPQDDRIDPQSSFHLNQDRLNRTVFRGSPMTYFRVGFRLPQAAEALDNRPIRKFDLLLRHASTLRTIKGGFLLQNISGRSSRDVLAADLHVSERDYEIVRVMRQSLVRAAQNPEADPTLAQRIEEVERFYESINEQVEAAIELWNESFRRGEIDRVFLAGDLADFVNIATTLERQGYRATNIRHLQTILAELEPPLFVTSGNHDHHGYPFPLSLQGRGFVNQPELQALFEDHYDAHRFGGILYFEGIRALMPASSRSNQGWLTDIIGELYAEEPFDPPNDDFLDHHLREIGTYETYGVSLGNGFRVFAWPTETEHFNYSRYLLEEVHAPVGRHVLEAMELYVRNQHVNSKGPRPEVFVAFLRELEVAQDRDQRLILLGHYPPFFVGEGPEQTPDSVDTLRGDASWAVRLASWYYRNGPNSVLALSVAGHTHHYSETDFRLHFADPAEEARFREELGRIFSRKDPNTIFDDLHNLRHNWDLNSRIEIRRVHEPGSNGYPGPIMQDFNQNCLTYCRARGTAFITLPALGTPTENRSGFVILTTHPDGRIQVSPHLLRVSPQGQIVTTHGSQMEDFRRARWWETRDWDRSRETSPFVPRTTPTAVTVSGPGATTPPPAWDLFPLVYQYPRGKIALTLDTGLAWDWRVGEVGFLAGGQLLFPLTDHANYFLRGPNYLALGAEYSTLTNDLNTRLGLDFSPVSTYFLANSVTSGSPFLGGEILFRFLLPLPPAVTLWGGSTLDGDWGVGLNLRLSIPALTYRFQSGPHRH